MKTAKEYLLENYLSTVDAKDRELWYQTNDWSKEVVEIMKGYAGEVVDELVEQIEYVHDSSNLFIIYRNEERLQNVSKLAIKLFKEKYM